jgi:hypothetical protein
VNSPVRVSCDVLNRITALGPVKYLVAPTKLHVWRLEDWHALFPDAELWVPSKIPNEFKRLPFAGILGDTPPPGWANDLDQLTFRGNCFIEEVYFLHRKSRTTVLADFIQDHPIVKGKPLMNCRQRKLLAVDSVCGNCASKPPVSLTPKTSLRMLTHESSEGPLDE